MLFNSYSFVIVFLPVTMLGYALLGRIAGRRASIAWLVGASLLYYGWWHPIYLGLIVPSILANYALGALLSKARRKRKLLLVAGVAANLVLLGYFKYTNFLIDSANVVLGTQWSMSRIVLPLAVSFFTFQQIAYLVDVYRSETNEYNLLDYSLFVLFFPQLIAGPIVHHKEMLPQFSENRLDGDADEDFAVGLTIFVLGLFKKVLVADFFATIATPVFSAADSGVALGGLDAWAGALAYTLQLYFDFSGYSDMAIGGARLFGIRLPLNFDSPYKSPNISEFWRRWHITLSRFLRDYLYISLGGNRRGPTRRYVNLMITMVLGGLWHGAGWTFVFWGFLHGSYLCVHHAWQKVRARLSDASPSMLETAISTGVTFLAVVVGWVFFRAASFSGAYSMLSSMTFFAASVSSDVGASSLGWIAVFLLVVWFFPSTQEFMRDHRPVLGAVALRSSERFPRWSPTLAWGSLTIGLAMISVALMSKASEFIYYQF